MSNVKTINFNAPKRFGEELPSLSPSIPLAATKQMSYQTAQIIDFPRSSVPSISISQQQITTLESELKAYCESDAEITVSLVGESLNKAYQALHESDAAVLKMLTKLLLEVSSQDSARAEQLKNTLIEAFYEKRGGDSLSSLFPVFSLKNIEIERPKNLRERMSAQMVSDNGIKIFDISEIQQYVEQNETSKSDLICIYREIKSQQDTRLDQWKCEALRRYIFSGVRLEEV